ncbi:hypothetical protein ACLKA7_007312 [Drosophila subpalustris]
MIPQLFRSRQGHKSNDDMHPSSAILIKGSVAIEFHLATWHKSLLAFGFAMQIEGPKSTSKFRLPEVVGITDEAAEIRSMAVLNADNDGTVCAAQWYRVYEKVKCEIC